MNKIWWRVIRLTYVEAEYMHEAKEKANDDYSGVCIATPATVDDFVIKDELGKGPDERKLRFIQLSLDLAPYLEDEGEGEA
jgi:hypothetical protein